MASYTVVRGAHKTLSSTTVDTVTLTVGGRTGHELALMVANDDTTNKLYYTYMVNGVPPAPTAGGDDTYYVPVSSQRFTRIWGGNPGVTTVQVQVIGNGGMYHVELQTLLDD